MARSVASDHPPGDRRREERRKKDGLGLLPRARTPEERLTRERLNRLVGFLLVVGGALIVGGLIPGLQRGNGGLLFGVILALMAMAQGVRLVGSQERRRRPDRRKIRSRRRA